MQYDKRVKAPKPRKLSRYARGKMPISEILWMGFIITILAGLLLFALAMVVDVVIHSDDWEREAKQEQKVKDEKEEAKWKRVGERSYASGKAYSLKYDTSSLECNDIATKQDSVMMTDKDPKKWLQGCLVHATNKRQG